MPKSVNNIPLAFSALTAISPVDGRYHTKTEALSPFFSEYGLIRYRVLVEVEYFIALCKLPLPQLDKIKISDFASFRDIYNSFTEEDARKVKALEKVTNHDVKAVEYFLREKFSELGFGDFLEFIHFGLTSQDINNTSIPLSLKNGIRQVILPAIESVRERLAAFADEWSGVPMLARTHGQPASPTRLGKEMMVFVERIDKQLTALKDIQYFGKFGGATGNLNAHYVAYPETDWHNFADRFLSDELGLVRNKFTTQIDHYDDLAGLFDNLRRINVILIDLCRDIWSYISMEYFRQRVNANEVGSSAMPHKVNPIDFENAEGNFGLANALYEHLSQKLPISRLQRDLTDSTVLRNIGVPLAHSLIGFESLLKGLDKILLNEEKLREDLESNWAVVAEAIQTILRREGYPHPYEKLKQFSRGKDHLGKEEFHEFIMQLDVNDALKEQLWAITPFNYTGK